MSLASLSTRERRWETARFDWGNTRSIAMPSANLRREIREGWRRTEDSLINSCDVEWRFEIEGRVEFVFEQINCAGRSKTDFGLGDVGRVERWRRMDWRVEISWLP